MSTPVWSSPRYGKEYGNPEDKKISPCFIRDLGQIMVEVVGVEPTSKKCQVAAHSQAWSVLETSRRGTDEPLGTCAS